MGTMFDYFYATEIEKFLFAPVPLSLIKEDRFKKISGDSKILYSLLLNRTALSIKNNWKDEHGRVYIIYTMKEIMEDLNCFQGKANKTMKELIEIGLVETVRQGLTKPNLIYVMNFTTDLKYKTKEPKSQKDCDESLKCDFSNSANAPLANQEMPESQTIYTDGIKNNFNQTDVSIYPTESNISTPQNLPDKDEISDNDTIDTPPVETFNNPPEEESISEDLAEILNSDNIPELVAERIGLEELKTTYPDRHDEIEMLGNIVCNVLSDKNPENTVRIGKDSMPVRKVQNVYAEIQQRHIRYVLHCLANNGNSSKIKSSHAAYYMTSLYNAPRTIGYYFEKTPEKPKQSDDGFDSKKFFERVVRKSMKF